MRPTRSPGEDCVGEGHGVRVVARPCARYGSSGVSAGSTPDGAPRPHTINRTVYESGRHQDRDTRCGPRAGGNDADAACDAGKRAEVAPVEGALD